MHDIIRCMDGVVTVAIPTLDAGPDFEQTLVAVAAQRVDAELDVLICDSGSRDRTVELARAHGAEVIEIRPERFSHGGTRNLLMAHARGDHVALLTQDAVPAADDWLRTLLDGFGLSPDVGLVFGPYLPRAGASLSVRRELRAWFTELSPDGEPRTDRLTPRCRGDAPIEFYGPLGYFTDANGCVLRAAWERVPFREVAYAEDHLLAQDMLRAGYAKVFLPSAGVVHSHEYSIAQWCARSFDEARGVAGVYGSVPGGAWSAALRNLRGAVGADVRLARAEAGDDAAMHALVASLLHHGARSLGTVLGARAERLPSLATSLLSLERRGGTG